jgi:hypothetical protein
VGILRDHWSYSPSFTTGLKLIFGMPIEELVFFIVVPICGLWRTRPPVRCSVYCSEDQELVMQVT